VTTAEEAQLASLEKVGRAMGLDIDEFVLPESRDVVAYRHRIHCLDWGTAGLPPIVFAHGQGLTAHTWDLVCLSLRRERHCLAVDLRGHGDSEWSPVMDYSIEAHARDIAGVVEAVTREPVVLVGMSLGGAASLRYAADHGDRLQALVIVDIGPPVEGVPGLSGEVRRSLGIGSPGEMDSVEDFVEEAVRMNPRRDRETLRVSLLNNLRRTPEGRWTWKYDRRHHERMAAEAEKAAADGGSSPPKRPNPFGTLWDAVGGIARPTLVVRGADSPILSPASAEAFVARLPNGRWVEVAGAGHNVQGDNPRLFVAAVREFLASVGA
jgi:pimeloyl-ACP methyl ester carboxylesterase